MQAVVFNKSTGEKIATFNEKNFNGNFYLGLNIANKKFGELRVIAKVGDSFSYKDFEADKL